MPIRKRVSHPPLKLGWFDWLCSLAASAWAVYVAVALFAKMSHCYSTCNLGGVIESQIVWIGSVMAMWLVVLIAVVTVRSTGKGVWLASLAVIALHVLTLLATNNALDSIIRSEPA
jgi:hypothetical protein